MTVTASATATRPTVVVDTSIMVEGYVSKFQVHNAFLSFLIWTMIQSRHKIQGQIYTFEEKPSSEGHPGIQIFLFSTGSIRYPSLRLTIQAVFSVHGNFHDDKLHVQLQMSRVKCDHRSDAVIGI